MKSKNNLIKVLISILLPLLFIINGAFKTETTQMNNPEDSQAWKLAQQQLDAYNNRDIEAFLVPYAENVKVYNFPSDLSFEGKDKMRARYSSFFENTPKLHCKLVKRMVMGNTAIDQEEVIGIDGVELLEAIAIYKIKEDKIAEVYFIK